MARNKKQKRLPVKPNPTTVGPNSDLHQIVHERHEFTGPLPPPSILAEYNTTVPGAADRIIAMAEQQSLHRRSLEKKIVYSGSRDSILGLIFGLIIGLATIIGGCVCVIFGHEISGSFISLSVTVHASYRLLSFALSGLKMFVRFVTQGVALG